MTVRETVEQELTSRVRVTAPSAKAVKAGQGHDFTRCPRIQSL
jgi:hypothetical protein